MNLYLTHYQGRAAVIAAGSVSTAREVFAQKVATVASRTHITTRLIKGATHGGAVADAWPFVLTLISD